MGIVLSLGYTSYSVAKQTIENNALSANQQTVEQTAEKLDVTLLRFEDNLGQLFYNKDIQQAVSEESTAAAGGGMEHAAVISGELNHWLTAVTNVQAVYLIPLNEALPAASAGLWTMNSWRVSAKLRGTSSCRISRRACGLPRH